MNTKQFFVAFLIFNVFVLTGCGGGSKQAPERPLYSGSDGVIVSFPESNALKQYQGDFFTISVRLLNDGTANITRENPGYVTAAFDPSVVTACYVASNARNFEQPAIKGDGDCELAPGSGSGSILGQALQGIGSAGTATIEPGYAQARFIASGREQFRPVGDIAFVEFTFHTRNLSENRQRVQSPINFQTCYPYTTTFVSTVCIDRDMLSAGSSPSCAAAPIRAAPQGAPVAITSVTPRYLRVGNVVQARYEIELENLHEGVLVWPKDVNAKSDTVCDLTNPKKPEFGVANVTAWVSGRELRCGAPSQLGLARFDHRKSLITCWLDNTSPGTPLERGATYEAPIIIQVRYFYIQTTTSQLEVMKR